MAGGLMQLVAYGAQDVYLTGNPKVTFFQAVYKKHTNFAMENIEQTVNGTTGDDGRISVTVARNGDLVGEMYLELTPKSAATMAEGNSCAFLAERAVKDIELSIGGQRIDKHYQRWWRLWSELNLAQGDKMNYQKQISVAAAGGGVAPAPGARAFLPLIFFFNRNPGLYLPLIALQYHEVRVDIDIAPNYSSFFGSNAIKVWANYVYLDTEERRRFAQKGHEYLIEQVQHTGSDTVTDGSTKQVRLSYNHPVKELVWAYPSPTYTPGALGNASNIAFVNYTTGGSPQIDFDATMTSVNETGIPKYMGAADDVSEDVAGPLAAADAFKLVLNGQDRFKAQGGKYFNSVQPYNHHSGCPQAGVYCYSFALKPEEHQPTGTCNFSRIDNAQVSVRVDGSTTSNTTQDMFAVNYNVLRIQSGMGGLAFSN